MGIKLRRVLTFAVVVVVSLTWLATTDLYRQLKESYSIWVDVALGMAVTVSTDAVMGQYPSGILTWRQSVVVSISGIIMWTITSGYLYPSVRSIPKESTMRRARLAWAGNTSIAILYVIAVWFSRRSEKKYGATNQFKKNMDFAVMTGLAYPPSIYILIRLVPEDRWEIATMILTIGVGGFRAWVNNWPDPLVGIWDWAIKLTKRGR